MYLMLQTSLCSEKCVAIYYTGCIKKKCPEYKIASKLVYLPNYGYQQQPMANIGLQVCISVNFVFICSILICKQGEGSKCFIFKWLAHKNFKREKKRYIVTTNAQPLKFQYFLFCAACLKCI